MAAAADELKVATVLGWAFRRLREEIGLVLLLSAFLTVVMLIAFYPLLPFYARLFEAAASGAPSPGDARFFDIPMAGYLFAIVVSLLGSSMIYVLFSRLSDLEGGDLMEGGLGKLMRRGLWVAWRVISATMWLMLGTIAAIVLMMIISLVLGFILTLFGMPGLATILVTTIGVVVYFGLILFNVAVYGVLSISIFVASHDLRIGIRQTWNKIYEFRVRLVLTNFILFLIVFAIDLVLVLVMAPVIAVAGSNALFAAVALLSLVLGVAVFLWLAVGAAFTYAVKEDS